MTEVATRSKAQDFAEFYATNFDRVAGQLYAYLGDRAEAQDAAQEAFCRAFDRWARIGAYEDSLAWVRRVAWNLATSRLRHLRAAARYALRQRQESVEGPGPDRVALVRALSTLPPKHRLAVVLHHIADLSVAQIAEQHDVAEGTVKAWLARGRSRLAEYFAEEVLAPPRMPVFQPAGMGLIAAKTKRRRAVRRSAVAAVLALAIAVPLALIVRAQGVEPPIIEPTPQPSPSPSPSPSPVSAVTMRPVTMPGADSGMGTPILFFVNKDVAWALYRPCQDAGCRYALGRTVDSGRTWSQVALPEVAGNFDLAMYPFDTNTLTLETISGSRLGLLHTTNGGVTFTRPAFSRPPVEVLLMRGGPFQMLCPGATGMEDTGPMMNCSRRQLVHIGAARPPAPPLTGPLAKTVTGGDGRIWLVEEGEMRVSPDQGHTWSDVPQVSADAWEQVPRISPDGRDVWLEGNGKLLRLNDSGWQEAPGYPVDVLERNGWRHLKSWAPLNDGLVALSYDNKLAFLKDGELTVVPSVNGGDIGVLADGTVSVIGDDLRRTIGVGEGIRREWIRFS